MVTLCPPVGSKAANPKGQHLALDNGFHSDHTACRRCTEPLYQRASLLRPTGVTLDNGLEPWAARFAALLRSPGSGVSGSGAAVGLEAARRQLQVFRSLVLGSSLGSSAASLVCRMTPSLGPRHRPACLSRHDHSSVVNFISDFFLDLLLQAIGAALLAAGQLALLPGLLRLAGPLAGDPALQLLKVGFKV